MRSLVLSLLLGGVAYAEVPPGNSDTSPQLERVTLKDAIARALARNPSVEVQLAEVRRSQAQLEQVRSASLPSLNSNGLYTRVDHDRKLGATILQKADNISLNLTASVPIIQPKGWARWSQARESLKVSEASVAQVRRTVAVAVASAYLAIIERRREVELNVRARDTAQAHHDYTHARLEGGRGSRLDDVRAEQELESDHAAVRSAELAVTRAEEALGVLVAGERPVDVAEEPWLAELDPKQALDEAPHKRADLLKLEAARHLAHRITKQDWTTYMPSLSGSFAPIYTYPGTVFVPRLSWQAQLVLTVPFYDGGNREGLVHEHRALEREAAANLEGQSRQARSEIRVGGAATRSTDEALARARHAASLSHDAVKIAQLSYEAGATTNIELIDAQQNARNADTAAAILEDAARQARIDLMFAAGELP
ncbi:MAG: TolC family protein [Polyangia bacterium]